MCFKKNTLNEMIQIIPVTVIMLYVHKTVNIVTTRH